MQGVLVVLAAVCAVSARSALHAPEDELAKEMTHDLEMNFNKIAPFGKEDTAKELQDHAAKTQDTLVDAVENAQCSARSRACVRRRSRSSTRSRAWKRRRSMLTTMRTTIVRRTRLPTSMRTRPQWRRTSSSPSTEPPALCRSYRWPEVRGGSSDNLSPQEAIR